MISEAHLLNQIQKVCRFLNDQLGDDTITSGGQGVFVKEGRIPKHALVAFYPGTLYRPGDNIFVQSVGNSFLLRCADGFFVDGNNRGLSKLLYRSCSFRDRVGPLLTSDQTWLTPTPANPLAIGQYVNNHTPAQKANVAYQEVDLPLLHFPLEYRRYIPNIFYNSALLNATETPVMRMVLLVSSREVEPDEELFSSYLTLIKPDKRWKNRIKHD